MAKVIQGEGAEADPAKVDNPAPNSASPITSAPSSPLLSGDGVKLKEGADKVIIDYYTSHLELFAETIINHSEQIIAAVPRLVRVKPFFQTTNTTSGNRGPRIIYDQITNPAPEDVQEYLIRVCGDAVKDLDLFSDPSLLDGSKLETLLSEYAFARSVLSKEFYMISPYVAVLAMAPSLRSIPTLALTTAFGTSAPGTLNMLDTSANPLDYLQSNCIPTTAMISGVARHCEVKNIIPILEELNRVKSVFIKGWEDPQ